MWMWSHQIMLEGVFKNRPWVSGGGVLVGAPSHDISGSNEIHIGSKKLTSSSMLTMMAMSNDGWWVTDK